MASAVETKLTTTRSLEGEQRVVIRGVGWDGYEALLKVVGEGHVRITYDGKDAELMTLSRDHEDFKKLIGRLIETLTLELDLPCIGLSSMTCRRKAKEKGLEADECYYFANIPRIRGKRGNLDFDVDPPPDLAVEVEVSRSALDKTAVYAGLGVPEVWRFDGEALTIGHLQPDGTYAAAEVSTYLPMLPPAEVVRWLRLAETADDHTDWARRFRDWVRAELLPRRGGLGTAR